MLSEDTLTALRALPERERLMSVLQGRVGPLTDAPFSEDTAGLAYMLWVAWQKACGTDGRLHGIPTWEAKERWSAKVRAARAQAGDLHDFHRLLFRELGILPEKISVGDAVWWRTYAAEPNRWVRVRNPRIVQEAIEAATLLIEVVREFKESA